MKKLFPLFLVFFMICGFCQSSQAQNFGDFQSLLQQLTEAQRAQFLSDLENIDPAVLAQFFNESDALDRLKQVLAGSNPIADLDGLFDEWEEGRLLLLNILNKDYLPIQDQDTLLREFDRLNEVWVGHVGDLTQLFDNFGDSLNTNSEHNDLSAPDVTVLLEDLTGAWDTIDPTGIGGLGNVLSELFNNELFTNLEFAYGRKESNVQFYKRANLVRMEDLQLIRVGTVPHFESLWEARWHASASWTKSGIGNVIGAEAYPGVPKDFNPFIFEGDFATMYNPGFSLGSGSARMITSLGFEVATYVPAHLNPENRVTWENVGYTTGYGPQLGLGFAINTGNLTTYTMATAAFGKVSNSEAYDYSSLKMEAGIRYGNAINVRYTTGQQDWAPFSHKRIHHRHEVTVGILLESLFH